VRVGIFLFTQLYVRVGILLFTQLYVVKYQPSHITG
jgi:hypothetical protein